MYFTETPHLQSIEAIMKTIPRHPQAQESEQKEGINMKLKFLSTDHRKRFLALFKKRRTNPLCSEPEYCAAIYLLTAAPELLKTVVDKAFEMAAEIRGEDLLADRHMMFNEESDNYERLSDEEWEALEASGEPQQSM